MLSIAKLRVGQEAYHLSGVAQCLDDYYTGAGESVGQWLGGGAARLDLTGDVRPDDLRAVLAGLAPGTGGLDPNGNPLRTSARRVPGFDFAWDWIAYNPAGQHRHRRAGHASTCRPPTRLSASSRPRTRSTAACRSSYGWQR